MKPGVFIETDNVNRFRDAVALAEDAELGRPGMMLVHGDAGRGKTVAAMASHAEKGGIFLRAWEQWSQFAFLQSLCFEVNGTRPYGAQRCKVAIIEALDQRQQIIYVDEADRLDIRRIEDLRDIHDETGCPICLIGERGLPTLVSGRTRINDRIPDEYRVKFRPITVEDIGLYALNAADLALDAKACAVVHRLCNGNFRKAHNLVLSLERKAKTEGTGKVDEAMARRLGKRGKK